MDTELVFNEDENAPSTRALSAKATTKTALESPVVPRAPLRERNNGEATSGVVVDAVSTPYTPPVVYSNDTVTENVLKAKPASSKRGGTVPSQAEDNGGDCVSASESEMLSAKLETMSFRNNALRSANRELESRIQELESRATGQNDQVEALKVQLRDATAKVGRGRIDRLFEIRQPALLLSSPQNCQAYVVYTHSISWYFGSIVKVLAEFLAFLPGVCRSKKWRPTTKSPDQTT